MGSVGRGKSQILSLEDHCLTSYLTPMHEIAHLLGIIHEHSRPDRDLHIKVYSSNAVRRDKHNFDKFPQKKTLTYLKYDYSSFMHYNNRAFSGNGKETIDAIKEEYQRTMGNTVYPSASVFRSINLFYNCAKKCSKVKTVCLNNGYPNPNKCNYCNCAEGFGGKNCEKRAESIGVDCGGDFRATNNWQTINETLIRDLGPTPYSYACYFHIKAPSNSTIVIRLREIKMTCSTACSFNNLMLNLGSDRMIGSIRLCCQADATKFKELKTKTNLAVLGLYSRNRNAHFIADFKID